jgi:antitoxin ParD1/3/4
MTAGKISVSLEGQLLDFLSAYQASHQIRSKSEVVAQALILLRDRQLEEQYSLALAEWEEGGDAALWEQTVSDGLMEDARVAR